MIAAAQAISSNTVHHYRDRRQRLQRLHRLLGPGAVPTFGEFAMAAGFGIWKSHALGSALEDAVAAGLRMPELWQRLSHSGHLFLFEEDWRDHRYDIEQFCKTVCAAMKSEDDALAWSARAAAVMVFRRMLGIVREPLAKPVIVQIVASIRAAQPLLLRGAAAECKLISLGLQYLEDHFAPPAWSLQSALERSWKTTGVLQRLLAGWRPGYSIGLEPVGTANSRMKAILRSRQGEGEYVRVIAPVPELVLYLNTVRDVAFDLAKVLPAAVESAKRADVQKRRRALLLAGDWGISAWVAAKGVRRWHENLQLGKGAGRAVPITDREMWALDYAVKNYRAAGRDALSSALASVLTSYSRIDRKFRKKSLGEVRESVRHEHFNKIASKYGVFIREAGFWVLDQELTDDARMVRNGRPKKNVAPLKSYEILHEEVGHASENERRLWERLFRLLDHAPSLVNGGRGERKIHLLHSIVKTLTKSEPFVPLSATLPQPENLRPQLEPLREQVVPVLFRLCLKHCRLKSALKLLVAGNGITMEDLRDFLRLWGRVHLAWPQLIDPVLEFRDQAMSVFSRYAQGPGAWLSDDNDYFEVLEALHGPMLAVLDARGDGVFQSWIEENLHEVAEGGWFDRAMLLPKVALTDSSPAHLPSLQWVHEALNDIGRRMQKPVAWVSFVATEDKISGLTMSGDDHRIVRWAGELPRERSLQADAGAYLAQLDFGTTRGWLTSRQKVNAKSSLQPLLRTLWEQIQTIGCNGIVLMNCPPELNSLPWRGLLQAWLRAAGPIVPSVYVVPGTAWLRKKCGHAAGNVALRTGAHGSPTPVGGGFYVTAVMPETDVPPGADAGKKHFDQLRQLCRTHSIVIDNMCFAGKSGGWLRNEWNGNPAALLFPGECKLLVTPPCLIPRSTTETLAAWVNQKKAAGESIDSSQLVAKLDTMAVTDSAARLYNLYGIP